jgi:6-phosphogluconate dehydrogenase
MQLGMVGLGRMGSNMVRRLQDDGHGCVVLDRSPEQVAAVVATGAVGADSPADLISKLEAPRYIWLMIPAGAVDAALADLVPHLEPGDTVIDGGNSSYVEDLRRAQELGEHGIHHLDVGVSGGVWGLERGYCLMIGGEDEPVAALDPIFRTLAPGVESAPRTPGLSGEPSSAERGYLHCGPNGAGHFVKMVHNGIEYGLMAAYAEGLNVLRHANAGQQERAVDAETAPLRHPERYRYDLPLPEIAEVWRRGSVVSSWLLDLTAQAMASDPDLSALQGRVSDSGEGRWTAQAAIDTSTPAPVLTAALFQRFASRGEDDFAGKVLSAMRLGFGGHLEGTAPDATTGGPPNEAAGDA